MFKTRLISSIVGIILLVIIMCAPPAVLGVSVFILSLIGLHEFYSALEHGGYKPVKWLGYLLCVPLLLVGVKGELGDFGKYVELFGSAEYLSAVLFAVLVILYCIVIFTNNKYNVVDAALTVYGVFHLPFLFLFITLTRNLEGGIFFIWLIFIGAWVTDTFAYIFGNLFGKRKITPVISPNKTLEGSVGGMLGCIGIMMLYGTFLIQGEHIDNISVIHFAIIGLLCGLVSQIGDLSASAIKRYVQIKDYGKIMPGHGGVLDRFDSILFVAPVVYFYLSFIIFN